MQVDSDCGDMINILMAMTLPQLEGRRAARHDHGGLLEGLGRLLLTLACDHLEDKDGDVKDDYGDE